jgi:hypothetical protein
MRDFFIWCSGASVEIVKKCDDKEISKYTNIGIVVFCVAFLSIFSATYFLSFAFNTEGTNFVWLYLPIGIIWGFIILSLDRAIVSTISKNDTLNIQILKSIPRVALALMIGIVVATPLEFKIFEKEVNNEINTTVSKKVEDESARTIQNEIKTKKEEVAKREKTKEDARINLKNEVEGKTGQGVGYGTYAKLYKEEFDKATQELNKVNNELATLENQKVTLLNTIDLEGKVNEYKAQKIGVIERVKVLYSLGGTHLAITILFVLIELLPLLTKLMSNKGGYDELILEEENNKLELARIEHQRETALKNELKDLDNQKYTQKSKIKLEIEKELQEKILKKLAEAQNEIAIKRIEEFRQKNIAEPNIPNIQQPINRDKLEDKFWKQKNALDNIEYFFRNGQPQDNELIYSEAGNISKGVWNYNQTKTEISIDLNNQKTDLEIAEIKQNYLKLKYKGVDDIIEFESS